MLITIANNKLRKAAKVTKNKYVTAGLSLAPAKHSGYNVCPSSTHGCREACVLWFSGRAVMPVVRNAMISRTKMFFEDREKFKEQLFHEVELFTKFWKKRGSQPCFRPNVASDLPFEKLFPELFSGIPDCIFYDYTKILSRFDHDLPPNYELTYSVSEQSNTNTIKRILNSGKNVSVVVDTKYHPQSGTVGNIPKTFQFGNEIYETVDGDKTDLRIAANDGHSKVICLRFKGGKVRLQEAIQNKFVKSGYTNIV